MTRFIDFYKKLEDIPTHQEGTHFDNFYKRRALLYRDLGIPMNLLGGKSIIEFGPGGAYNARPILDSLPYRYDFVDAMDTEIAVLEENVKDGKARGVKMEIFKCMFTEFQAQNKYDLVIAEACIPGQDNPQEALSSIMKCVDKNGFLVITNTSKTSLLSEILRSVIGKWMSNQSSNAIDLLESCVEFFGPHLESLKAETRTTRDWVLDNIIHEWHLGKSDFSLPEASSILEDEGFTYNGGSPRFFRDFLWYKHPGKLFSGNTLELNRQYGEFELFLLDYRLGLEDYLKLSSSFSREEILPQIEEVFDSAKKYLKSGSHLDIDKLLLMTKDLAFQLSKNFSQISQALREFSNFPEHFEGSNQTSLKSFQEWWGRGQQYNSFQKN